MILTADWHLSDKPDEEYRWRIFDSVKAHSDGEIYILGDLCDRADRHSSVLVNRLVSALTDLTLAGNKLTILCGNHDRPLKGPPYWEFLNQLKHILFVSEPCAVGDLLLLPYAANPREDWKGIPFNLYNCIMMHQTIHGVTVGHGRVLENPDMLGVLPVDNYIYSGDIHHCQTIGNVTYVGAPHPVRFGDSHRCRFLLLNSDYHIEREIILRRMRKSVIEIRNVRQLEGILIGPGDQARIRFVLPSGRMEEWPAEQQAITAWAKQRGIRLASVEAIVETGPDRQIQSCEFNADPEQVLEAYCRLEGIDGPLHQAGLEILRRSQ